MDIESKLPEDFDELSREEKIEKLEEIKDDFNSDSDADIVNKRLVEELIRSYRG